jgi:hypothetical protein
VSRALTGPTAWTTVFRFGAVRTPTGALQGLSKH